MAKHLPTWQQLSAFLQTPQESHKKEGGFQSSNSQKREAASTTTHPQHPGHRGARSLLPEPKMDFESQAVLVLSELYDVMGDHVALQYAG